MQTLEHDPPVNQRHATPDTVGPPRLRRLWAAARPWLTVGILIVTAFIMAVYFVRNPQYWQQLLRVPHTVIIAVILLNVPAMAALALAYDAMVRLCGRRLGLQENILLTAYSSIVNFFGPLQSGPAVRTVYLKVRHGIRVRDFTLATLLYLTMFACMSALLLVGGVRPWWQSLAAVAAVGTVSATVVYVFVRRGRANGAAADTARFRIRAMPLLTLLGAVMLQLAFIAGYFYVELHAVDSRITVGQAISYTGAANFSLFVSITPDAVGIREAFLVFSQHIHGVPTPDIISANLIDRSAYIIYLLLLFVFVATMHAKDRLKITGWRTIHR